MSFFNELKRRNVIRVGFTYGVVGWVIAQVADLALESFGAPDWVMKTLLFLMFVGFVIALFIAWAYELTPEGIKRAEDVDHNDSITGQTGRKLDKLAIVVLLLAVALLLVERFVLDEPASLETVAESEQISKEDSQQETEPVIAEEPSVAVLPFVNMSSDPEQEFFSDGISEEILNVLTRIPNLKVAARTSSFQFKGQNLDIADVGKQLQVNHILEGSVRKAGDTLRITAQLIEVNNGFHLWSQTFDRKLEDVFAIQDEIAAAIAKELRARFTTELDQPSVAIDINAYSLYLKGRGLVAGRKQDALMAGIEILQAALEIEPEYAPAMATMAKAYVVLPYFSSKLSSGDARQQARHWSTKAIEIDPDNVEALSTLAIVAFEADLNPNRAIELLTRAIELNPGSVAANNFLGDVYTRIGDFDNALKHESRAAELDPLGAVQLSDLSAVNILLGEYSTAIELSQRALALDPAFPHPYTYQFLAYFIQGDIENTQAIYEAARNQPGVPSKFFDSLGLWLEWGLGNTEPLRDSIRQNTAALETGNVTAVDIAFDAVAAGDFDTAGDMLLKAHADQDGTWLWPVWIRLPEQAPDSEPWQEFWSLPGVSEIAEIRRKNGLDPHAPGFGEGAKK
jgi:TolB-like protein/Tfp pilus assembly protein PilF